ncbi:MAG: hypothetical protein ACLPVW_08075 [Terriglobales bacterium]
MVSAVQTATLGSESDFTPAHLPMVAAPFSNVSLGLMPALEVQIAALRRPGDICLTAGTRHCVMF